MTDEPQTVAPERQYLGVACSKCGKPFPIVGPLDPEKAPPDKPMRVATQGPLKVECPHCHHSDAYPADRLRRVTAP